METKKLKAFVLVGLPGSGKSSWAYKFMDDELKNHGHMIIRINNDVIRNSIYYTLGHRNWSKKIEEEVRTVREDMIRICSESNTDIIVDNTHMNSFSFNQIQEFCKSCGYEVEVKDFRHVSVEECIRRDSLREGIEKVGEEVIRKMAQKNKPKTNGILPNWKPNGLPNAIIVDIDGTLSYNTCGRSFYDENRVYEDTPRLQVVEAVKALQNRHPDGYTFIFSGRTMGCYDETSRWLDDKCGLSVADDPFNPSNEVKLVMRNVGDSRHDSIVKAEMYDEHIADKFNVIAVFDDRASVIRDCWDKLGLFVFRCGRIDQDEF